MYVKHAGKYFATLGLLTVTVRLTALASPIWFSKLRRAKKELRRGFGLAYKYDLQKIG